jgi:hypothetical protein
MKTKPVVLSSLFFAGLLLGTAWSVCADTLITFQCDMTYQVQNNTFTNGVTAVYARGTFDKYGAAPYTNSPGFLLTNNFAAINTNLYTGIFDDTLDTNGAQMQYKFYIVGYPNSGYEVTADYSDNRVTLLPAGSGQLSLVLPVQFFSDQGPNLASPQITVANVWFQVDMSQQIALGNFNPAVDTVQVNGSLGSGNNFGFGQGSTPSGNILTNDPTILSTNQFGLVSSNVYVGYLASPIAGSPGQNGQFKYIIQPTAKYEAPGNVNGDAQNSNNRFFFLTSYPTNPTVFFSDQPYAPIGTNTITFSVDMTVQAAIGAIAGQQVRLSGDFNNWDTTGVNTCTNNPNAANTNIYYATVVITNGYGATTQFKFGYVNGNYENNPSHTYPGFPTVTAGDPNRQFNMPSVTRSNLTLPTVYFDDISTNTVLSAPTMVTFTVNMTNAVGDDASVFDPDTENVYLNGMDITNSVGNYSFDPWTNAPAGNPLGNFQMVNNPAGSEIYTITVPVPSGSIPAGYPLELSYQYTYTGLPIEALNGTNHIRYIRSTGSYVLPEDKFGSMVQESAFGDLAIGSRSAGNVPISWLGLPGVSLQTMTNLTSGTWLELPNTYGQNSTNYPVGTGASFFRLIQSF